MKLTYDMIITEIGDDYAAVPTGAAADAFHGIIRLNETGRDIWNGIAEGLSEEEIAERLVELYDGVDKDTARACTEETVKKLRAAGFVTD